MKNMIGTLAALLLSCVVVAAAEPLQVDDVMLQDPAFVYLPPNVEHYDKLPPLWIKALARPEEEIRRSAADTISVAHGQGMPNLEIAVPLLIQILEDETTKMSTARAVARALIVLDAREAQDLLFDWSKRTDQSIRQLIEPALASWGHQPTIDRWNERLADADATRALLLTAIRGAGAEQLESTADALEQRVTDDHLPMYLRFAAAASLGAVKTSGLTPIARRLSEKAGPQRVGTRLLAIRLLSRHEDSDAVDLLEQLLGDEESTVVAAAIQRLFDINPELLFGVAAEKLTSRDVNVRRVAAQALVLKHDVDAVGHLVSALADRNPGLRQLVASELVVLAEDETLRKRVIEDTNLVLGGDDWRSLEQAILVLTNLDYKPAAERYIELLKYERPEVFVTAAWGLRRLKIKETLPALLAAAEDGNKRVTDAMAGRTVEPYLDAYHMLCSQCFQAFGEMLYAEAEPLMRKYIPKGSLDPTPRGAAIWAFGYLYQDQAKEDLTQLFVERLKDVDGDNPEFEFVRRMCSVSLGRMRSEAAMEDLRNFAILEGMNNPVGFCCWWSINRMTGEEMPEPVPVVLRSLDYFLIPLRDLDADQR